MGVGGQRHILDALPLEKRKGTHITGGCLGPNFGMDGCGKPYPYRHSIVDRLVCSESHYRLSYLGPHLAWVHFINTGDM